jgi:hypothetical protein
MLNGGEQDDFVVVRLDGRTGRPRWRAVVRGRAPRGSYEAANDAAIAAGGDVVAAGSVADAEGPGHYGNFAVVSLHGVTGSERWRFVVDDAGVSGMAVRVGVDAEGDVVAAGHLSHDFAIRVVVVKLAGETGTVRWRQQPPHVGDVRDMVLDRHGVIGGEHQQGELVAERGR